MSYPNLNALYTLKHFDAQSFVEPKDIEYKKVDVGDFIQNKYNVSVIDIFLNTEGYVTEDLLNKIDITTSSTEVINIPTGSGKTTAIYQLIKRILEEEIDSLIIMATPFKSLVDKDFQHLTSEYSIDESLITHYEDLTKDLEKETNISLQDPINKAYIDGKRIHITTINAMLRNPGDVAFEQKYVKTQYYLQLLEYCRNYDKKVYLFLDEIHASIHNFKNEYIHNLTMWKGVIYKCFVSTATYTEPVNIVVKHLAYLTKDNIHVLECDRQKKPVRSPLDICLMPESYSTAKMDLLEKIITEWLKTYKSDHNHFHILSYSKKLAKELGENLKYSDIQLITSETKHKFSEEKNNIGTSFSTGVDIKNPDDLLIIIFPSKYSDDLSKGEDGIFYDGLPSVLQAVARLRVKGRILFIISPMKSIIETDNTKELIKNVPHYSSDEDTPLDEKFTFVKETFLADENKLIKAHLKRLNDRHEREIDRYNEEINDDGVTRPEIQYPNDETFILERGQEYLKFKSYKSGKHITPYVLWAAVHDQFLNCSLQNVYYFDPKYRKLHLSKSNLTAELREFLSDEFFIYAHQGFHAYHTAAIEKLLNRDNYILKVYLDEAFINPKKIRTHTTLFYGIVSSYLNFLGCHIIVTDIADYLRLMFYYYDENYQLIDMDIHYQTYMWIHTLIDLFLQDYQGKSYTEGEIVKLPFFTEEVVRLIFETHDKLKSKDSVLQYIVKNKNSSFWDINSSERNRLIKNFISTYIERGEPKGKYKKRTIEYFKISRFTKNQLDIRSSVT